MTPVANSYFSGGGQDQGGQAMKCGHLFNGIGGFALASSWMGWSNIMHCEIDAFCNKVMNYHFPNSHQHEDIRTTDFGIWKGRIDLITGGFPCQPFSTGGDRRGSEDPRHLWPEMLRAIREISPRWIVAENVRGLTNWNGGMVFDQVQADMEAEGYEVIPFLLPTAGVGSPHRRYRIWFIAHARSLKGDLPIQQRGQKQAKDINAHRQNESRFVADAQGVGMEVPGANWQPESQSYAGERLFGCNSSGNYWRDFPTQPPVCSGNDGFPGELDSISFLDWREGSLTALGNAIVPKVAHEIFKAIDQYEQL